MTQSPCPAARLKGTPVLRWRYNGMGIVSTCGILSFKCELVQTSLLIYQVYIYNHIKWDIDFLGRNQWKIGSVVSPPTSQRADFLEKKSGVPWPWCCFVGFVQKRRIPKWVQIKGSFNCHTGPTLGSCPGRGANAAWNQWPYLALP